jgi:DNA-binding MarR family transcriptional regulator
MCVYTPFSRSQNRKQNMPNMMASHTEELDLKCCMDCMGFNLRKATRSVSQFYDEMLRPTGIRGTQFSLLIALQLRGEVAVTQLAELIVMDRTTLTRNLEVLEKQGFVKVNPGVDRRSRLVSITEDGQAIATQAYPLWHQAQSKIKAAMGTERSEMLLESLKALIQATQ